MSPKLWSRTQTEHQIRLGNVEKKIATIKSHIHTKISNFPEIRFWDGEAPGAEVPDFDDSNWKLFPIGQSWGGRDKICWFRIPFQVPEIPKGEKLAAIIQPGKKFNFISTEGGDLREYELFVFLDGQPLQSVDVRRNEIPLWDKVKTGQTHLLAIEAFSGLEDQIHFFKQAELVAVRPEVEDYYYNTKITLEAMRLLEEIDPLYVKIYKILYESLLKVDFLLEGEQGFYDSIKIANSFIKAELKKLPPRNNPVSVVCIGHSHLDIAWKWQTKHSRKKIARTTSNVLRQMEFYPHFRYMGSQPQLYQYLSENYPELYNKIKQKVKSGKWEATGGMWCESDCNLPGGESLVRQFLYGKRFFQKEFGVDNKVAWLPDVFGFCYSLPQIIKKSGMEYFSTTKLSWSQFTDFPHDTFWWQGVDGTKILAHYVTTPDRRGWQDYAVDLNPANIKWCWDHYQEKELNEEVLLAFGWGDGGGGPTPEMQEHSNRMDAFPHLPKHRQDFVETFFVDLHKRVSDLPVWNDELYLEYHRGCYTSQAQIKRNNRKSEVLLHNAEFLAALNFIKTGDYPHAELNKAWEFVLLNQFHDILPGSSLAEVYEDSEREYEIVRKNGNSAIENSLNNLAEKQSASFCIVNTLGHKRSDLMKLSIPEKFDSFEIHDMDGNNLPFQILANSNILVETQNIPSYGWKNLRLHKTDAEPDFEPELIATTSLMENDFFKIQLDKNGHFISIFDKRFNREVIEQGQAGNVIQAFEDRPLANNAWDIEVYFQDKKFEIKDLSEISVLETGPIRAGILIKRKFLKSTITQKIYIYRSNPRIDFETEIDWHQHQTMLKVAFPVNVSSPKATYEIPYGAIERATHSNTIADKAKFEVSAQKWADLSDGGYGVSLLNDCKYGYDIKDNVMRLTLLRSPIEPDPNADIGLHRFTYSLLPHNGDWRLGETVKNAYELNFPLLAKNGKVVEDFSFIQCNQQNVIIESIKKAEDEDAIVVRLYEVYGKHTKADLTFNNEIQKAMECNLLEKDQIGIDFERNKTSFDISPFEIKTFMLFMA